MRTSLVFLVAGFGLGSLSLCAKALVAAPQWMAAVHVHFTWVVFGWMLQFALGIAYWIFPRVAGAYGPTAPVWAAWGAFNAGLVLLTAPDLVAILTPLPGAAWVGAVGSAAVLAAVATFAYSLWRRAGWVPPGLDPDRKSSRKADPP